jgi:hypothetical protein
MGLTQEETHTNPWHPGNLTTQMAESSFPRGLLTLPCKTYPQLLAHPQNDQFPSARSQRPLDTGLARGAFPYTKAIEALAQFRLHWVGLNHHTDEPFIVWLSHPKSHTKINPAHFFAKGFSPAHTLFLESSTPSRVLPPLFAQERGVAAVVLDGYPSSRIVLQLARRWLKNRSPTRMKGEEILSADSLFSSDQGTPRLFVMAHHPGVSFDGEKVAK